MYAALGRFCFWLYEMPVTTEPTEEYICYLNLTTGYHSAIIFYLY